MSDPSEASDAGVAPAFPSVSLDDWRSRVERELGGRSPDRLARTTPEGVVVEPLATERPADLVPETPGRPSYRRGGRAEARPPRLAPRLVGCDLDAVGRWALEELEGGADALVLRLDRAGRLGLDPDDDRSAGKRGVDGLPVASVDALDRVLDGVILDAVPLLLEPGGAALPMAALVLALCEERGLDPAAARLFFHADPLGALARDGALAGAAGDGSAPTLARVGAALGALARHTASHLPGSRAVGVSVEPHHGAGAHGVQELAWALGTAVWSLRRLEEAGLDPATAAGQVAFTVPVGRDLFVEVAKLRALRVLWSRTVAACGVDDPPPPWITAVASRRTLTRHDPWVDMLRGTLQTVAACLGGADAFVPSRFDEALEPETIAVPGERGRRLARNTLLVLAEESHLGRVVDPAGGSHHLETLTDALARRAWETFTTLEAAGGMVEALTSGRIHDEIGAAHRAWADRVARREAPITGISEFPALDGRRPAVADRSGDAGRAALDRLAEGLAAARSGRPEAAAVPRRLEAGGAVEALVAAARAGATLGELAAVEIVPDGALADAGDALAGAAPSASLSMSPLSLSPLPLRRDAEPFEVLRDRVEASVETSLEASLEDGDGERPAVFLATLGPLAEHKPRADFAANLFAAAGVASRLDPGVSSEDDLAALAERFTAAGTPVACLCGSDERYRELAGPVARRLRAAGVRHLLLAGRDDGLPPGTVDGFVHRGSDAVAALDAVVTALLGAPNAPSSTPSHSPVSGGRP